MDGRPLGEKNPKWLQDDYVKFIRWAVADRADRRGHARLHHQPRLPRQPHLPRHAPAPDAAFTDIYILDLHGNTKKKDAPPTAARMRTSSTSSRGRHRALREGTGHGRPGQCLARRPVGLPGSKEAVLASGRLRMSCGGSYSPLHRRTCSCRKTHACSRSTRLGWSLADVLPVNSVGIVTARDRLTGPVDARTERLERPSRTSQHSAQRQGTSTDLGAGRAGLEGALRSSRPGRPAAPRRTGSPACSIVPSIFGSPTTPATSGFICIPEGTSCGTCWRSENLALIATAPSEDPFAALASAAHHRTISRWPPMTSTLSSLSTSTQPLPTALAAEPQHRAAGEEFASRHPNLCLRLPGRDPAAPLAFASSPTVAAT